MMPGTMARPGVVGGLPSLPYAISPIMRVGKGSLAELWAFNCAIWLEPRKAPSMRRNSARLAPSSTTAMFIFQPSWPALASQPSAIFLAMASSKAPAGAAVTSPIRAVVSMRCRRMCQSPLRSLRPVGSTSA